MVRHGPDHEAADGGEGHRVGEVSPVLRRLRVALAEDDDDYDIGGWKFGG